jgi:DnaK suppressor protein
MKRFVLKYLFTPFYLSTNITLGGMCVVIDITLIQEQLEADLREAEKKQQKLDQQLDERPDFGLGTGNTGSQTWEMNLARRDRIAAEIESLQEALRRVREGTYDRCENCGAQIDPERLEILPTTTLCANCA